MAWVNMQRAPLEGVSEQKEFVWELTESISSATGNSIIISGGCDHIGVTVKWTSGTYAVYATTSTIAAVKANTATWFLWDLGTGLAANAQDEASAGVSAIRIVTAGGTSEIQVSAK